MVVGISNRYSNEYLNAVRQAMAANIDGNGGKKDGKVTVQEALNSLNIGGILYGIKEDTQEYKNLKTLADNIPQTVQKYAGKDGVFQAYEWANFLNGNEWGQFLELHRSSSKSLKQEMQKIEQSQEGFKDGLLSKGELKVGIINNLRKIAPFINTAMIESIIDKYAGQDGIFSVEEYAALKKDPCYDLFLKTFKVSPCLN